MMPYDIASGKDVWDIVLKEFDGDKKKTKEWFETKNPFLGNVTPMDLVRIGKVHALKEIVKNIIDGNIA